MRLDIDTADTLIISADIVTAQAAVAALAPCGCGVRVASGFEAAMSLIAEARPDLVVIDVDHPGLDGFAACQALRNAPASAACALLLVGQFGSRGDIARAFGCGANDVLRAPFDPTLLQARVRTQLALVRALAAQRAASDLLAGMGHEIRTPMTAILGMSHLALRSGLDAKQRNYIEKVQRSAEMLLATLNDILDHSTLGAGKLGLHLAPFTLDEVLDSTAKLVALKADDSHVELLVDAPTDLPSGLIGDRDRLRQVLVRLAAHALLGISGGELVIGVEPAGGDASGAPTAALRFSIRATAAPGSPPAAREPAAGLGLAIAEHLIGLMGSTLSSTPDAHDFVLRFERTPGATPLPSPPVPGARVLVVDDNAVTRRVLKSMCASFELDADAACDGWDALRQVTLARQSGRPYALLLMDATMPLMDGPECLRKLAADGTPPPVVMLSHAFGRDEVLRRLATHRLAVHAVLDKPLTPAALRAACLSALRPGGPAPTPPLDPDERLDDQRARLRGARLLVVEDNTIIQKLALDLLGSAGIQVTLAGNGREALARLAERPFDGVLMDCQMPVMDGLEATRALRLLPQFATLPVIALTADALDADREHVIQAGMNDLISKPLDVDQMFATLARWVRPALPATAAASPAHAEATDPLAALPGIDARIGRNSTMNNDKLYRRLLGMFHEGQHQFVAQFRSARTAGDHATAMRLAHNLRAVSASLGAVEVHRSASALERACADRAGDAEIAALLDAVAADLDPVIAGLAQLKAA